MAPADKNFCLILKMSYLSDSFKNKKITMLGLGVLGRGINVAKFLAQNGAILTITDLKNKEELAVSIKQLKRYKNIIYILGRHRLSDFRNKDMIIKAAGVPLYSPYILEAKKNNIPVEMDASLFARLAHRGVTIVGITGTRGKSTVTNLVYESLKKAKKRDQLGRNVRGIATLPLLKIVKSGDIIVMELVSWQLQGFGSSKISPHIAVFTTFMRDHLNYYNGNMRRYFNDKANIFANQKKEDILIIGEQSKSQIQKYNKNNIKARKIYANKKDIPDKWSIKIPGEHNRENISVAMEVLKTLKISKDIIKKSIESFNGVTGRLEYIGSKKGIKYYNDTTATTPDALKVALASLGGIKKVVLIAGGNDKKLDYTKIGKEIKKYVKALVLIDGTATKKILKSLKKDSIPKVITHNMESAIKEACNFAKKDDIVLLSPGAASFGIFKNEFDRGDQFVKLVKNIK
jgi:UDP-N-acetylmuramoylalanine--D-glutamate ligase